MTVKELIEHLQKADQDLEVEIEILGTAFPMCGMDYFTNKNGKRVVILHDYKES